MSNNKKYQSSPRQKKSSRREFNRYECSYNNTMMALYQDVKSLLDNKHYMKFSRKKIHLEIAYAKQKVQQIEEKFSFIGFDITRRPRMLKERQNWRTLIRKLASKIEPRKNRLSKLKEAASPVIHGLIGTLFLNGLTQADKLIKILDQGLLA